MMDSATYTQQLRDAFKPAETWQEEVTTLLDTSSLQFPEETAAVLVEAFVDRQVDFKFMKNNRCIESIKAELVKTAVEQKVWMLVAEAYDSFSIWSSVVFCHLCACSVSTIAGFVKHLADLRPTSDAAKFCYRLAQEVQFFTFCKVLDFMGDVKNEVRDCYHFIYTCKDFVKLVGRSRRALLEMFRSCSADERRASQYMAVLIASRLSKWKFIQTIFQNDRVIHYEGCVDVLCRALTCKAWACAATVLHKVLLNANFNERPLKDMKFEVQREVIRSAVFVSSILKPFLRKCIQLEYYCAGALLATWAEKWGLVRRMLKCMHYGRFDNSNATVISQILREAKYALAYDWLHRQPQTIVVSSLYADCVLSWCCYGNFLSDTQHQQATSLVSCFMNGCENPTILMEAMFTFSAEIELLLKFFSKDLLHRVSEQQAQEYMHCLLRRFELNEFTSAGAENPVDSEEYKVLLKWFEAGCSTRMHDQLNIFKSTVQYPSLAAVLTGVMPVIRIFYYTGAMSNSSVFDLHKQVQGMNHLPADGVKKVQQFMQYAASSPRSLSNLCCIRVSELIGCRADRKQRALSLGLPMTLTRKVLFLDVLYPEEEEIL